MSTNNLEVTTIQDYSHQEGYMTAQCVVMASNERVREVLKPYEYGGAWASVSYEATVYLLVQAGITVIPVRGLMVDGFNSELYPMEHITEDAPGFHFDGRTIMDEPSLEKILAEGKDYMLNHLEDEEE